MPAVATCRRNHVARYSNYAQLQRLMSECRAVTEPAEAHGSLAGALCATDGYGVEDWLAEILPEGKEPDERRSRACATCMRRPARPLPARRCSLTC